MPERIQRRRTKGWRMPENTVYVGRGTKWGNPCRVVPQRPSGPFDLIRDGVGFIGQHTGMESARRSATFRFRNYVGSGIAPSADEIRTELAGKNLACWCPFDQPCHADVLLEIANGGPHA